MQRGGNCTDCCCILVGTVKGMLVITLLVVFVATCIKVINLTIDIMQCRGLALRPGMHALRWNNFGNKLKGCKNNTGISIRIKSILILITLKINQQTFISFQRTETHNTILLDP